LGSVSCGQLSSKIFEDSKHYLASQIWFRFDIIYNEPQIIAPLLGNYSQVSIEPNNSLTNQSYILTGKLQDLFETTNFQKIKWSYWSVIWAIRVMSVRLLSFTSPLDIV
jgi:hypothetical protein